MKIDKRNGNVAFEDGSHTYWNVNDNEKYISVTTLIHRYTQPFLEDFWSSYKALEKLLPKDTWVIEKRALVSSKKITEEMVESYGIDLNTFNKMKQDILDEWDKKNRDSCERGTKIHAELEQSFYNSPKDISLNKYGIGGKFECRKDYTDLDLEHGVYPEYLVYRESDDGVLRIAGQIDLLIKQGNDIFLVDHKTNAKIDVKSGYDGLTRSNVMMKYPLNNLMDCNFIHYSLQLSTYAWMLQKINPDFVIKDLIINHYDHQGNNVLYHCDYLKRDVEKMLLHYKKELALKKHRESRKKIEY